MVKFAQEADILSRIGNGKVKVYYFSYVVYPPLLAEFMQENMYYKRHGVPAYWLQKIEITYINKFYILWRKRAVI